MFKKNDLEKKSLIELKKIADKNKLEYKDKITKNKLIEIILTNEENEKKREIINSIPDLPKVYGKNKIVLMIKDPYNGFAYWDIDNNVIKEHDLDNNTINKYIRVYDITECETPDNSQIFFDIRIDLKSYNKYINFPKPNRTYIIDLGYFKNNKFIKLLRSNSVILPRVDVSEELDNEWVLTEKQFESIMEASGADIMFQHDGSQELMKFLAGNIGENISS